MKHFIKQSVIFSALLCGITTSVSADKVNWTTDVEGALRTANQSGQLILMKFTADWCGPCRKMEHETFGSPAVASTVNQQFVPILVNIDKHKQLAQHLKIKSIPAIIVVSPQMVILDRMDGFQTAQRLLPKLQTVVSKNQPVNQTQVASAAPPVAAKNTTRPVSQNTASWPPAEATPTVGKAPAPQAPVLPSFGGLCLPSVNETRSLVSGSPEFSLIFRGKKLNFRDAGQMQKFRANPELFWPMHDGNCPVTQAEGGQAVEGELKYAAMFRGKLWLSSSAEQMQKFVKRPTAYANALQK